MSRIISCFLVVVLLFVWGIPNHAQGEEKYKDLSDPALLQLTEDEIYTELVDSFRSEDFIIENVKAIYISDEYLEELAFNSQENIFFGYKLSEIQDEFKENGYYFTLGDDHTTVIKKLEAYDDTFERTVRNLAIGSGVILVCVTVSWVTAGIGLSTASLVFAAAAKSGTTYALSAGTLGAVSAGVIKGFETGDIEEALKAAALQGSESFKWGAISGAVRGGFKELKAIHKAAKSVSGATEYMQGSVDIPKDADKWRQAELRALNETGGYDQVSYLNGELVDYGTAGATRPDVVRLMGDHIEAVEVKYYDLSNSGCMKVMCDELQREVSSRLVNLPAGSTQRIILDVTDRGFGEEIIDAAKNQVKQSLINIYPDIPIDVVGAMGF